MSYGISAMGPALGQGFDMYRQDKRQDQHDQMDQETHQARMRGMDQQYGIRGDEHGMRQEEFGAWQDDRDMQAQAQDLADSIGREVTRLEMTGDPSGLFEIYNEKIPDGSRFVDWQRGEDGMFEVTTDDGQSTRMDPHEIHAMARSLGGNPGAVMEYLQAIEAQKAEAQQGELDHQRDIQSRLASRVPGERVTMDDQGQFGLMDAPEDGVNPADQTAKMREARDIAGAFGIELDAAWSILMQPRQQAPDAEIRRIADSLMKHDRRMRNDPSAAFEKAGEIYGQTREMGEQYGLNTMRPGGAPAGGQPAPGGQPQPTQDIQEITQQARAAVQSGATPEQIEQRMRERGYGENEVRAVMEAIR